MNKFRLLINRQKLTSDCSDVSRYICRSYCSEKSVKGKEESAVQSYSEEKQGWNILKAFSSQRNSFLELHRYGPFKVSMERIRMWKMRTDRDADLMDQKFIGERHKVLGNDLATAHFIVFRGGKVKFLGRSDWIVKKGDEDVKTLPKRFIEGWLVESIDASGLPLRYEAFQNLIGLYELKSLILRGCPNVDDWCIDRISGEHHNTLEHLDLSDCHKVSERALTCLYRCKKLKTLVLNNIVKTKTFEYSCLLLEDVLPQLTVEGVKYLDVFKENNT